jgi:hypothetical protein
MLAVLNINDLRNWPAVSTDAWHGTVFDLVALAADALQVLACVGATLLEGEDVIDLFTHGDAVARAAHATQWLIR